MKYLSILSEIPLFERLILFFSMILIVVLIISIIRIWIQMIKPGKNRKE